MAHFWVEDLAATGWSLRPLGDELYGFSERGLTALERTLFCDDTSRAALLGRRGDARDEEWVLLAGSLAAACVNGQPLVLGARVLRDRDEIVVRGPGWPATPRCFFSTERLAVVAPLPDGVGAVKCPRCKEAIEPGQMAVRCPSCNCWHHQIEGGKNCWTYLTRCASCDGPTDLDGKYRWSPQELET
jgi:hypothetical protein